MASGYGDIIPGTRILVDGFKRSYMDPDDTSTYVYFLSHFHADHYGGIKDTWDLGIIYCSNITGGLLVNMLGVSKEYVVTLDMNVKHKVVGPGGKSEHCSVTLTDANHCPGAALLLFEMDDGTQHLHTGDFRASETLRNSIERSRIHTLFLDTTYFDAKHTLPDQDLVIEMCARIAADARKFHKKVLIVVTAYNVGKEKIVLRMMEDDPTLKVGVDQLKMKRVFLTHNELAMNQRFTVDLESSGVHIWRWGQIGDSPPGNWTFFPNYDKLKAYAAKYKADKIIGIVPSGWCYGFSKKSIARDEQPVDKVVPWLKHGLNEVEINGEMVRYHKQALDNVMAVCVPYSEHSSYTELIKLVEHVRPKIVFPTVVSKEDKAKKIAKIQEKLQKYCDPQFAIEEKHAEAKRAHLKLFGAPTSKGTRAAIRKGLDAGNDINVDIRSGDYVEFVKPSDFVKNGRALAGSPDKCEEEAQEHKNSTLRKQKTSPKVRPKTQGTGTARRTRCKTETSKKEELYKECDLDVKRSPNSLEVENNVNTEDVEDVKHIKQENDEGANSSTKVKKSNSYSNKDKEADIEKLSGLLPVEMTRDELSDLLENKGWSVMEAVNAYFDNETKSCGNIDNMDQKVKQKTKGNEGFKTEDSTSGSGHTDEAANFTIDLTDDTKDNKDIRNKMAPANTKRRKTTGAQNTQKQSSAKRVKSRAASTRGSAVKKTESSESLKDTKPKAKQGTLFGFFKKVDLPAA